MGVRDLFFAIKARDETGAAFDRVKANLRQTEGMAASTSERMRRVGVGMRNFGLGVSAFTGSIMFAFRDSLALFDTQERAQAKVAQAVKSTGGAAGFAADELFRQASALQAVTRFGDEAILDGVTAQLLTFTNIAGEEFQRAQTAALDMATVLGSDLQSASIMLGKALNDPVKGLTAMSRAGVTFSKDQSEVIKSLAETGRIAEAQGLILDELAKQYGGQAEAAAQAGMGALDQLSNSWGDLKEEVGGVIAGILPPITAFFRTAVDGFMGLPQPVKAATVALVAGTAAMGAMTAAAGLLLIALAPLGGALAVITGPVGLAVAGLAALVGIVAALWPETDNATAATDTLTLALGDEITQSQLLATALGDNTLLSVDAARKKLAEAKARHENVKAIIAEQRALALNSTEWSDLTSQIEDSQSALNSLGFPSQDVAVPMRAEAFEGEQQRLADLLRRRQALLDTDKALEDQLKRTEQNILDLETGLGSAEGGVVRFGDGVSPIIPPVDRLGDSLDRTAATARNVKVEAGALGDGLEDAADRANKVADVFDGFGRATSDMLKDVFSDGRVEAGEFGEFLLSWGDKLLGNFLDQVFDPLGDAIQGLFDTMGKGGSGGGGGLFGGLFSGVADWFGGLFGGGAPSIGMDTGGVLGVSGREGIDRNVARFRVSNNEDIHVVKRGQPQGGQVSVTIVARDPNEWKASKGRIARDLSRAVAVGGRYT